MILNTAISEAANGKYTIEKNGTLTVGKNTGKDEEKNEKMDRRIGSDDAGIYSCEVVNEFGILVYPPVLVKIAGELRVGVEK